MKNIILIGLIGTLQISGYVPESYYKVINGKVQKSCSECQLIDNKNKITIKAL